MIVVLAGATFFEKFRGTEAAHDQIYGAWWFSVLWGVFAAIGLVEVLHGRLLRRDPALGMLHLSFVVIIAGAMCTKLWGETGQIALSVDNEPLVRGIELPFEVRLDSFTVEYHEGTNTPSDYVSRVTVRDKSGKGGMRQGRVSMNRILKHRGYRLYQSSLSPDHSTTILAINHDPVGIAVTYTGFAMFFLSGLFLTLRRLWKPCCSR